MTEVIQSGAKELLRIAVLADPTRDMGFSVITGFGEAKLWSETQRFDLRASEVASPRPGDRLEIGGEAFLIQGELLRDAVHLRGAWGPCSLRAIVQPLFPRQPDGAELHFEQMCDC